MNNDDMDNDDLPVGRVHSRREVLALFGVSGAALIGTGLGVRAASGGDSATLPSFVSQIAPTAAGSTGAATMCVVTPAETEGPYFVEEMLNRSDIRTDPSDGTVKDGVPLELTFNIATVSSSACSPLAGATVDVWHCDALGMYSDVTDSGVGFNTVGKKFLRGTQTTDATGAVKFTTIYPGWYQGRAVHIHFKVRTTTPANTSYEFTSQLFFDDSLTDQVYTQMPYASKGRRDTRNSNDGIYATGGDQLLLAPTQTAQGYAATFAVGLDLAHPVAAPSGGSPGRTASRWVSSRRHEAARWGKTARWQ